MNYTPDKVRALEKIAYGFPPSPWGPTVGAYNPPASVGDVLNSIGLAQVHGIGTPNDRRDAFGRIINSGLATTSPAGNALRMIGGGMLGRAIAGAITNNSFIRGLGAGIGAVAAADRW